MSKDKKKKESGDGYKEFKKNKKDSKDKKDKKKGSDKGAAIKRAQQSGKQKKIQKLLLDVISSRNYQPMRAKDIAVLLDVPKAKRKDMLLALDVLEAEGKIEMTGKGCYQKARKKRSRDRGFFEQADGSISGGKNDFGSENFRGSTGRGGKNRPGYGGEGGYPGNREQIAAYEKERIDNVVLAYGISPEFPSKVLDQAAKCPNGPIDGDFYGRTDLRGITTITIDGDDSRDFDDAVSLERDGSGYILGVHIADVTNYVQASSALDHEALKRGTSVYLADRVIPMLPEKLSNGTCSLNEGEDRLTLSCIIRYDHAGNVTSSKVVESVICSAHRMTYSEVDKIFTEKPQELTEKYADVIPMLFAMKDLAACLEEKRHARGMIDFEFPETKIELDEDGHPIRVYAKYPTTATKLIEQFMLSANEEVAKKYFDKQVPFLYRSHEEPDEEKMETVLSAVRELGIPVQKTGRHMTPLEVQKVIADAKESGKERLISTMMLRSMQQARYSPENKGHFGLAAKYYCHFTSPIRRYPDLQIHRIIKDDLRGRLNAKKQSYYGNIMEDVAWKTSALERRAAEVERETTKIKSAEYILDHIGEETDAVITGVTGWGIYVQRPDTIEGLVHVSAMRDDHYEFDEEHMRMVGRSTGKVYEMGQNVRVRTRSADAERRIIDFELVELSKEAK